MRSFIIQVILLICATLVSNAQKFITLTPREQKSGRDKIVVSEGNRIKCRFIDGSKIVGIVDKIFADSIQINDKTFAIENIKSMAKRKRGSTAMIVAIQIVPALGGAISIEAGNLPIAIGFFAVQIIGSQLLATHLYDYPLRNIKNKWVLDVHEFSNKKN
jgi:hypothetical protein